MVHVRAAGKTVWSPCYTQVMLERFRDKHYKVLYNFTLLTLYVNALKLLSPSCVRRIWRQKDAVSHRQTQRHDVWNYIPTVHHRVNAWTDQGIKQKMWKNAEQRELLTSEPVTGAYEGWPKHSIISRACVFVCAVDKVFSPPSGCKSWARTSTDL